MNDKSQFPEWLKDKELLGLPELDARDAATLLIPDLDDDAQLMAIRDLLHRNRVANKDLEREIERLEEYARRTSGRRNELAVGEWVDRLHGSVYQDAARSMAAVGMLAPLVESIFSQAFQGIRKQFFTGNSSHHPRWQLAGKDQWDCHLVWNSGGRSRNLVAGIVQLAEATGLTSHLPNDLEVTLQALFEYRNKMFHCGFEWPVVERIKFETRISQAIWPSNWFAKATSDGLPWVFYLTDAFIDHCLTSIDKIIDGLGAFANEKLKVRGEPTHPCTTPRT